MDHSALSAHQLRIFNDAQQLMQAKNTDYASTSDALSGFKNGSRFGLTPLQTLGNYMFKHVDAIEAYIRSGKLESEPIDGRILDCINYLTLLSALIHENDPQPIESQAISAANLQVGAVDRPYQPGGDPRCEKCNTPPGHNHAKWCPYGSPLPVDALPQGGLEPWSTYPQSQYPNP